MSIRDVVYRASEVIQNLVPGEDEKRFIRFIGLTLEGKPLYTGPEGDYFTINERPLGKKSYFRPLKEDEKAGEIF